VFKRKTKLQSSLGNVDRRNSQSIVSLGYFSTLFYIGIFLPQLLQSLALSYNSVTYTVKTLIGFIVCKILCVMQKHKSYE
jgi:hypothetical protein